MNPFSYFRRYQSPFVMLPALTTREVEFARASANTWFRIAVLLVVGGVLFRVAQVMLEALGYVTPAVLDGTGDWGDALWHWLPTMTVTSGLAATFRAIRLSAASRAESRPEVLEKLRALCKTHPAVAYLMDSVLAQGRMPTEGETSQALAHGRYVWPAEQGFFREQLFAARHDDAAVRVNSASVDVTAPPATDKDEGLSLS